MRSRILHYKNNLATYDFLTQFPVKNYSDIPNFSSLNVKIKNIQTNDIEQVCLNLVSIQLVGNTYITYNNLKNIFSFTLKSSGLNIYFILENLFLLTYKNRVNNFFSSKNTVNQNKWTVKSKNIFNTIEYFALNSNFLKYLEKTPNKHLSITFSYQIINSENNNRVLYLMKSLGFPSF